LYGQVGALEASCAIFPRAHPMETRPFPYERWPKLSRTQLALLTSLQALWDHASVASAHALSRELLGSDVAWRPGVPELCDREAIARRTANALVLRLEQADVAAPTAILVELSNETAQAVVDRALGGEGTPVLTPSLSPLDELSRGALAYVAARVLAALGGAWGLADLNDSPAAAAWFDAQAYLVWPIRVAFGAHALPVRVYVPEHFRASTNVPRALTRDLGPLPVQLVAYAGAATLPLTAARALQLEDILVLDHSVLVYDRVGVIAAASGPSRWKGSVLAHLPGSRDQLLCRASEAGLEVEAFTRIKEPSMTTGRISEPQLTTSAGPSFAGDAPIELQVELARFSLTLAELQRMRPGDVLVTGRRIGDHVSVRMGGRVLAEGELVDVEGEVGVRLLAFPNEPEAP
jgi:flagellar motor switch/type III secretory pathway protein FliN